MATYSLTANTDQPRTAISAAVERVQTYVSTATQSDGDVTVFTGLKIPHGAVITECELRGKTVDGTVIYKVGINGSAALLLSATISATTAIKPLGTGVLPYTVSVSDDANNRYVTLQLTQDGAATSGTTSTSISWIVRYVMDP